MRTVVELDLFVDLADGRLADDELFALKTFLSFNPTAGDLIKGSGGARKLRWGASGRGKSGGARVITYWHCEGCPVYLLTIYLKNERANLTQAEINTIKAACKELANHGHEDP